MAKKNVTAAAATTPAAPKSTKKVVPVLPCALKYYWQYGQLAWNHCTDHLARFAAKSPRFTQEFIAGELVYIKEIKDLPNNKTRKSMSSEVRLALQASRQMVADNARELETAINYTFKDAAVAAVQRGAAGLDAFAKVSTADWGAVSDFISTAKTYLKANIDKLVAAGAVNADFAKDFESVGISFNQIWDEFIAKRQTAKDGTQSVSDGIKRIKAELDPMLELGFSIFKYEPELRKLFTSEDIVSEVRSGQTAGISGRIDWASTEKPIGGVLVEVLNEKGKIATTDAKGRYEIKIAAGEYLLRFSSVATLPFEQSVTVTAGVTRRVNVVLEAAPAEMEPKLPGTADKALSAQINHLMKEIPTTNGVLEEVSQ